VPIVSAIVPVYNGIQHLDAFFESLAAALPDQAQVIIVDDNSTQPVLEVVPELPRAASVLTLRNEVNLGNSGAVNRGFTVATGDIVIQLNSDLVLDPGCITAMVELIEREGDDVGVVGSKLVYPTTGRTQSVGMAFGFHSKRHVYRHLPEGHPLCRKQREVQIVTGATAAMTRQVLELLGPLNDDLYNHNLDLDHCLRAAEHGLRNFMCADSVAYHWRNRSGPIRYARVEAAEAAFWAKWGGRYRVDLAGFFDEAIDHVLHAVPQLNEAPFTILDLSRSADQAIAIERLEARWPGIGGRTRSFRQLGNDAERLRLPLLLPHWLSHEPTPFVYLVDSHQQLEENAMWFARRRAVVAEELVVDLSASVCTTSEFASWQAEAPAESSVDSVVDVLDS
jgi:GT2 family glycosyltransferase